MATEPKGTLVPDGGGDDIPLIREQLTLGRRESCDIRMPFPNVSNVHAQLDFRDGYWFVKDMNSTNGLKVNGMRVLQKVLLPGDKITIAKRSYTIHYTLAAGRRALEEIMEDDIMSQSLLERAGLVRPKREEEQFRRAQGPATEPDIDWNEQ